jgi:ribonuclease P/MRP protein subunit RPP1
MAGELHMLSRITYVVEDLDALEDLTTSVSVGVRSSYDIVAVQPTSQQTFTAACERADVDLITLDCSQRLQFHLSLKAVQAAHARGVRFELCYSPAIQEAGNRRHLFSTAQTLNAVVGGFPIVLSSGASDALVTRGPFDVSNLASLMGLGSKGSQEAHHCVSKAPLEVIRSAQAKREAVKLGVEVAPAPLPFSSSRPSQTPTSNFSATFTSSSAAQLLKAKRPEPSSEVADANPPPLKKKKKKKGGGE